MVNPLRALLESKGKLAKIVPIKQKTLRDLLVKANPSSLKDKLSKANPNPPETIEEKLAALRGSTTTSDEDVEKSFFGDESIEEDIDMFDLDIESDELTVKLSIRDGKVKLIED